MTRQLSKTPAPAQPPHFDVHRIREDFPILHNKVHNKTLVYLDNAATTQKPNLVINALRRYYGSENANIHRGVYLLSQLATDLYEQARRKVQRFINAAESREIIFTRGTTEAINLVASSYGRTNFKPGDQIILTGMEHLSNIVPWQIICQQTGAVLRVAPFDDNGELILDEYERLFTPRTRFVTAVHLSKSLGTINPVKRMIAIAHAHNVPVFIDGAQSIAHGPIDVQDIDADFYAFSGHKLYGPTGIGALYGKARFLEEMPPYQGGGDMIASVTFEKTEYNELPYKFEAGTPNIAGGIGLGAAIDYLTSVGLPNIVAHESRLLEYAHSRLSGIPGLRVVGTARQKGGVISFVLKGIHPHDIGTILDGDGIAVRTGHHCCQPVMDRFQIPATARASFALYNTIPEIDALADGILKVIGFLGS
ncbi:MAG: cysteine desulfurase [Planctomycetota bacterium]|nr:cysteine desulfurase [Planctomycetota bacterium]